MRSSPPISDESKRTPTIPRVFIGLPVYNSERFLAEALDSLLAQSFTDFTLLISDNASTDDTKQICESYVSRDPRIRYVRHPKNVGAPRNWNFVAKAADGEYFKWATGNDLCSPDMLARCVAALDADPTSVLSQGRTCLVDEDDGQREEYKYDLALLDSSPSDRLKRLTRQLLLNNGQCGVIRLSMLRKTRLERLYPSGDVALMAELALLGRFIVLPEILLYRRMGNTTFTCQLKGEQLEQFYGERQSRISFGHVFNMHLDIIRATLTMPLPLTERLAALHFSVRHLIWDRHRILAGFR